MAITYGLTSTGFVPKTLEVIKAEYEADFGAGFGVGVNVEPESVNGQLIGIFAERDTELWEALADIYSSLDPDQATGVSEDTVLGITGSIRHGAKASTASVLAVGTAGTVLSTGRVFSVQGSGVRFVTLAPATLAAVPAWIASAAHLVGDLVALGGSVYYATVAGSSAASGGPSGTGTAIVDGTITWRYVGAGSGAVLVPTQAQVTGPKPAYAWTLTTVETAVAGLNAVTNPTDAAMGMDIESDAAARERRELELRAGGASAVDAIRAAVLQVPNVTVAYVFENTDPLNANSDGMPPNSVEAVVSGGDTETVRATVFNTKAGGIQAYGNNSGTVVDQEGLSHTVAFTRPTSLLAYLDITVAYDVNEFPSDGITQIKQALANWGDSTLNVGDDLPQSQLYGPIFTVAGVTDASAVYLGLTAWPVSTATLVTTARQLIDIDTARIRVNGV